jgi:hypothetical protein
MAGSKLPSGRYEHIEAQVEELNRRLRELSIEYEQRIVRCNLRARRIHNEGLSELMESFKIIFNKNVLLWELKDFADGLNEVQDLLSLLPSIRQ